MEENQRANTVGTCCKRASPVCTLIIEHPCRVFVYLLKGTCLKKSTAGCAGTQEYAPGNIPTNDGIKPYSPDCIKARGHHAAFPS